MAWGIHTVMQDTNDGDPVVRCSKVNHVPLNTPSTIAWSDVAGGVNPHKFGGKKWRLNLMAA